MTTIPQYCNIALIIQLYIIIYFSVNTTIIYYPRKCSIVSPQKKYILCSLSYLFGIDFVNNLDAKICAFLLQLQVSKYCLRWKKHFKTALRDFCKKICEKKSYIHNIPKLF